MEGGDFNGKFERNSVVDGDELNCDIVGRFKVEAKNGAVGDDDCTIVVEVTTERVRIREMMGVVGIIIVNIVNPCYRF